MKPLLIGLTYDEYLPGMKLYLRGNYELLKEGEVVEILEVNGYDRNSKKFTFPKDLFFIVENGLRITWNSVPVSCYIERDVTTSFIESMIEHFENEANARLKDVHSYEWNQRNYDDYLEEKYSTLNELLLEYERMHIMKKGDQA